MSSYRIGQVAEMLGVSADTVRRLADSGRIHTVRSPGGQRLIEGPELANFLGARVQLQEPAAIVGQSARNRFPGVITRVIKDRVAAQVEIQAGPHRVVALTTREAVDELGLAPGMRAVAAVKATNVVVEVPR